MKRNAFLLNEIEKLFSENDVINWVIKENDEMRK